MAPDTDFHRPAAVHQLLSNLLQMLTLSASLVPKKEGSGLEVSLSKITEIAAGGDQ